MRALTLTEDLIQQILNDVRKQLENSKSMSTDVKYTIPLAKNKLADDEKVQVHFSSRAYYKMKELIKQCSDEIGWDGIVERDPDNNRIFYIEDIIVFPQIVSGATVDTDDDKYAVWLNTLDDDTFNKRRFNGHSHVNMGVTPSSTDMTYREQSIRNIPDFFIFGIFNKRDDHSFSIYDIENNVMYDNDDIDMYIPIPDYTDWAKEVIKSDVTRRYGSGYYANQYNGYGHGGYATPATTTPVATTPATTPAAASPKTDKPKTSTVRNDDYYGDEDVAYWEEYWKARTNS